MERQQQYKPFVDKLKMLRQTITDLRDYFVEEDKQARPENRLGLSLLSYFPAVLT
jgi:hypothetical protein